MQAGLDEDDGGARSAACRWRRRGTGRREHGAGARERRRVGTRSVAERRVRGGGVAAQGTSSGGGAEFSGAAAAERASERGGSRGKEKKVRLTRGARGRDK